MALGAQGGVDRSPSDICRFACIHVGSSSMVGSEPGKADESCAAVHAKVKREGERTAVK